MTQPPYMPFLSGEPFAPPSTTLRGSYGTVPSDLPSPPSTAHTITGTVSGAGAILSGTGYSAVRNSAGVYTITFATPFSIPPVVFGTVIIGAGGNLQFSVQSLLAGSCVVATTSATGTGADQEFCFVAIATV